MHTLQKMTASLHAKIEEQANQLLEMEDELQATEDAKLRLEVNMTALRTQYDRDILAKEESGEDKKRSLTRMVTIYI